VGLVTHGAYGWSLTFDMHGNDGGLAMMSASWNPPGVTHDLLEYLKAESIREERVWGGGRNRSEAQNGVSEPPTYLLMSVCAGDPHSHLTRAVLSATLHATVPAS